MSKKGNPQQVRARRVAQARRAADEARRQRERGRRVTVGGVVAVVVAVGVVAILLIGGGGGEETEVATTPSTTAPPARRSVAGQPCVPVAGPLPPGAPAVPVKVGPPPTELVVEDLKEGTGPVVTADQNLTVHYTGVACSTGKIFDSSYRRGEPVTLSLEEVIQGWEEGIPGMKVGGQRLLGIPSDLGYGPSPRGGDIAPDETLWFVVEVVEAKAG